MRLGQIIICILCITIEQSNAGSFAPGSGIELSDSDIAVLEASRQYVFIDGEKKYLIGDQLFSKHEISTKAFEGEAWTNGTILYSFQSNVSQNPIWVNAFNNACNRWSSVVPNVRCLPRNNEPNFVEVRTHTIPACVSYSETTGMKGGRQVLSIYHDPTNFQCSSHWNSIGVITHEIGHVYGLVHEQSRWDRGSYLDFLVQNLMNPNDPSQRYQFRIIQSTINTTYTPYDFISIMHYPDNAYAKPGRKTLIPSTCYVGEVPNIGSQGVVTDNDRLEMQHHYGLPIYDMLKEQRDGFCGAVRINPSEKKHFCDDLGENCGPGITDRNHSAITTGHSTWWCPRSFGAACNVGSGPHRSCCSIGKEPLNVQHRRGKRDCTLFTERRHVSNWSCGCPYYIVYARCAAAVFGFNKLKIEEHINSGNPSLRTLGKFVNSLIVLVEKGSLQANALDGLEDVLIRDYGLDYYFKALDDSRRKIQVLDYLGVISSSKQLTRQRLNLIIGKNMERRRKCEACQSSKLTELSSDPSIN